MAWYERFQEWSINKMYRDISEAIKDGRDILIVGIGEGFEL